MLRADLNESHIWWDGCSYFHQVLLLRHTSSNIKIYQDQDQESQTVHSGISCCERRSATPPGSSEKRFKWLAQKDAKGTTNIPTPKLFRSASGPSDKSLASQTSPRRMNQNLDVSCGIAGCHMMSLSLQGISLQWRLPIVTDQACWEVPHFNMPRMLASLLRKTGKGTEVHVW